MAFVHLCKQNDQGKIIRELSFFNRAINKNKISFYEGNSHRPITGWLRAYVKWVNWIVSMEVYTAEFLSNDHPLRQGELTDMYLKSLVS